MKRVTVPLTVVALLLGSVVAKAWADGESPFGKFGEYQKVQLNIDHTAVEDKGVIIDGNLYVPINPLRDRNKAAYYYDVEKYQAYLFFGGGKTSETYTSTSSATQSGSRVPLDVMENIPYDADNYHSGMMRQDILNIAALSKALLSTSQDMNSIVYSKLTYNKEPDLDLLEQRLNYRSAPFEIMEDRMYALASELGRQLSSSDRRKMNDIIDDIQDAVNKKNKALDSLRDWVKYSDEDDLDDFKDYEKDGEELLVDVIKKLTGENLSPDDKNKTKYKNNLLDEVAEWSTKQRK